jgi:hypothetical protein
VAHEFPVPAQQRLRRHDQALAAAPGKDSGQRGEEGTIGRPKTRALLPTEHRKLMAQNQQFDILGELAATALYEQPQQRREGEIRERKEHRPMLPDPATATIENRNLVLEPLTAPSSARAILSYISSGYAARTRHLTRRRA